MLIKACAVKVVGAHTLWLEFSDGAQGEKDLSPWLAMDRAIVEPLRDPAFFGRVFLERGAPTWPNGFDLAPWALYDEMARDDALVRPPSAA
jgi:uncharacterized protein DUF2442